MQIFLQLLECPLSNGCEYTLAAGSVTNATRAEQKITGDPYIENALRLGKKQPWWQIVDILVL